MDELNPWHSHPDPEDELAYMYGQREDHAGMPQHFAGRRPEHHQYYTPPPPNNPMHPSHPHQASGSFPGFRIPALPSMPFGALAVKSERGQPSSSSSIFSFGGQPHSSSSTLNFSGGDWPPDGIEAAAAAQQQAPERRSRAHWNTQEHVIAERKRREKMQQQFVALATIVPDLTKTDKISLLGSTIEYVKQLEEKVKTLEGQNARRTSEPTTVFESKCRISTNSSDASGSRESTFGAGGFSPTVEASVHGDTILLKIFCEERRGVLVTLISELENQGLSIINTSVLPFTHSCLNITITAKIGEEFFDHGGARSEPDRGSQRFQYLRRERRLSSKGNVNEGLLFSLEVL